MAFTLDLGNLLVHLNLDSSQYKRMLANAETQMKVASQNMIKVGRQLSLRVTAPIVAMGVAATKAFADFDQAMTRSLAIMNDITPQVRMQMESLALSISQEGVVSAKDLATAYFFLASAGLDAQQSMAALGAVTNFAVAGAFDMATATDLATDAQSALGLTVKDAQKNLENMTRVTDVLVGVNTLANATTEQFSRALTSQAGPAMKAFNIGLEEGVAVLAAFADQGIKAERAGNLFSRMLRLMTKGFISNEQAWKRFNINIFDANKNLKPMHEIIGDISEALDGMSDRQKITTLNLLGFQARSQQAILPLIGLQDKIEEYNIALEKMGGITAEVRDKQLKSFSSQITILKNQFIAIGIGIGDILAPRLLELTEAFKRGIARWNELSLASKRLIIDMLLLAASIGPLLIIFGSFIKLLLLVKVAALLAAGSITILAGALGSLLVAISGFRIGTFLFNEFKVVQDSATNMVKGLEKAWVTVEFGFKQMVAGMKLAWFEFTNGFLRSVIDISTKLPSFLGGISDATAKILRKDLEDSAGGIKVLQDNLVEFKAKLQDIDDAYVRLAEARERAFAAKGENITGTILDSQILSNVQAALDKISKTFESWGDQFDSLGTTMDEWFNNAVDIAGNIGEAFANAFDRMSIELADFLIEGKANFADFAKSVMKELLAIVIRAQIITPIVQGLGLTTTVAHAGGVVGSISSKRTVSPVTFIGAPRFHQGGRVGLRSNEVPIIAERGEIITPAGQSPTAPTIIINNESGQPIKQQGAPQLDGKNWVISIVAEDINQFGSLRQLIGGLK